MAAPEGTKIIETPKGRALVATRSFGPGDLIATFGDPLLALPDGPGMSTTCNHCLRVQQVGGPSLRACGGCKAAVYCAHDCRRAHWKAVHKHECKMFVRIRESSGSRNWLATPSRAVAQVLLLLAAKDAAMEAAFGRGGVLQGNVDKFHANKEVWADFNIQCMGAIAYSGMPKTDEMMQLAREVLCKIQTNAFNRLDQDSGTAGIFLDATLAAINHSCVPNAYIGFDKRTAMVRAQAPIPEGTEIEISYIDNTLPKSARHDALRLYHFTCVCPACQDDLDVYQLCAVSPVLPLNKFSLRPDLENLRNARVNRSDMTSAKINITSAIGKTIAEMAGGGSKATTHQRWKLCKSLAQAHMWAVAPLPDTIRDMFLECQANPQTFAYALPLACFTALLCDPISLPAPFMPWRIKGMMLLVKLLAETARVAADRTLVMYSPCKDLAVFETKLDLVSMCEAVLRLVVHWGPIGAAANWDLLKEAREMLEEVESLPGREKESAVLRVWAQDPANPEARAFVDNTVLRPMKVLAALTPSIVDVLTGLGGELATGNIMGGSTTKFDMEHFLKEGDKMWADMI